MKLFNNKTSNTANNDESKKSGNGIVGDIILTLVSGVVAAGGTVLYFFMSEKADDNKKENAKKLIETKEKEERATASHKAQCAIDVEKAKLELRWEYMQKMKNLRNGGQDDTYSQPEPQSDLTSEPWTSHSFDELMDCCNHDNSEWILPGYAAKGQITFMVACASVGKTTLMVQQAWSVATGNANPILPCDSPRAVRNKVLFYRLEEFVGEFEQRYGSEGANALNDAGIMWKTLTDLKGRNLQSLLDDIKAYAEQMTEDTLICVDPVTKLPDFVPKKFIEGFEESQKIAQSKGYTLSGLISAHLEEVPEHKHISSVNIQGSDKLIQQAGAVFALCKARGDKSERFIQTMKSPKGHPEPDDVLVCNIVNEAPFLHMKYQCRKRLEDVLPPKPKATVKDDTKVKAQSGRADNLEWTNEMVDLLKKMSEQKVSQTDIAKALSDHLDGRKVFPMQVSRKMVELGLQ